MVVETGSMGELMVDLANYGWFPRQLARDAAEGLEPFIESDVENNDEES